MSQQEAELTILYNFYIDCMPSDDMAEASGRHAFRARGVGGGGVTEGEGV